MSKKNDSWVGLFGRMYDNSKGLGKSVHKGSIRYARLRVKISLIIGILIGIGLLIFSIIAFVWNSKYKETKAEVNCENEDNGKCCKPEDEQCPIKLKYDGNEIEMELSSKNRNVKNKDIIEISYLKDKPTEKKYISDKPTDWKTIGLICIVISIIMIIGVSIQYYMVNQSDFAATTVAASNFMKTFK